MRSDEALLLDMLIAARRIQRFTDGMTLNDFNHSEVVQSAVLREIQVIGEAGRRVSDVTRVRYVNVPWAAIAGMRNRIIHEYFNIDLRMVWDTVQQDIPLLIAQLEQIVPADRGDTSD